MQLSAHWELVIWVLARWCALKYGRLTIKDGSLVLRCSCGSYVDVRLTSATAPACPRCGKLRQPRTTQLFTIYCTSLSHFFRLLRRRLGASRGYPLLGDIPFMLQAPIIYCTDKIAKSVFLFLLAPLSDSEQATARQHVYNIMGRSTMGGLYQREFLQLVAHLVAFPTSLGMPLDNFVLVLLRLCQLLSASWRRAVGGATSDERERAAATMQLTAALLAPLYMALKPFDPVTKSSGVFNLYLHTALAHARPTLGAVYPAVNNISDDNIEGKIAEPNTVFNTRTNNVSGGQSLVNKEAVTSTTFEERRGRKPTYQMMFTEMVAVCPCVFSLEPSAKESFNDAVHLAAQKPTLSVLRCLYPQGPHRGNPAMTFYLPDAIRDDARPLRNDDNAPSMELLWQANLSQEQRHIAVCTCGALTGVTSSPIAEAAAAAATNKSHANEQSGPKQSARDSGAAALKQQGNDAGDGQRNIFHDCDTDRDAESVANAGVPGAGDADAGDEDAGDADAGDSNSGSLIYPEMSYRHQGRRGAKGRRRSGCKLRKTTPTWPTSCHPERL